MKPRFLLPHSFKKVGWALFIPALAFGVAVQHFEFAIPGFSIYVGEGDILVAGEGLRNNLTNELAALLILLSGFCVAFSKEKIEDERVSQVRLESLQWSVYFNYALLFIALLLVYNTGFIWVMMYNMFALLIFFIIRFHFVLYVKNFFGKAQVV